MLAVPGQPGSIFLPDLYLGSLGPEGVVHGPQPIDSALWCTFATGGYEERLPVLFGDAARQWGGALTSGQEVRLGVDVFGTAFWTMARVEELMPGPRDEHDRFSAFQSHAWRNGYLWVPIVDEYVRLLKAIIVQVWPGLSPAAGGTFRQFLSHDVDDPYAYRYMRLGNAARLIAANAIKQRSPLLGLQWIAGLTLSRAGMRVPDPCDTFDWLMDQSERVGASSTFYFLASDRSCKLDADYDISDPAVVALLRRIAGRGHEIGIHPCYRTFNDPQVLEDQIGRLRAALRLADISRESLGGRMHYLRWNSRTTPGLLAAAGLAHDSTMGFADYPGFRCGTCHPFHYFDPIAGRLSNLLVRPLVVMESTVMSKRYMNLGATPKAFDAFKELKDRCRRVGGEFGLLWHNSSLFGRAQRDLYESVISA